MKRAALVLISLAGLSFLNAQSAPANEGPPQPSIDGAAIWQKAERMSLAAANLKPSIMKTLSNEYSSEGKLLSTESTEARLFYGADGEISRTEIISCVKNGKDLKVERQKDLDSQSAAADKKGKKKEFMNGDAFFSPFAQDDAGRLFVSTWRRASGGASLEADFTRAWKNGITQSGTVSFNAQGGQPLYMDYSIKSKIPGLRSSAAHVVYMPVDSLPEAFVVKSLRSEFEIDLLGYKKRVSFSLNMASIAQRDD